MDLITNSYVVELALTVGKIMLVVGPLLIAVAYLTLAERRVIGFMQLRKGPNVVGPFGMFQPFADALKLMVKETILPAGANKAVFILAPMLTFILALVAWAVIPFGEGLGDRRHQCRHPVSVRDFLARRLWRDHGRLGQ